jgi:pimeloyl-ACP methyl ester carboxylesterase
MKQRIIYIFLGILSLIVLATIIGVIYEMSARSQAARDFPPPGKLVDIGKRNIQLDCRGTGSPTVVFESGLDMFGSLSWSLVHDEVAKTTRACAYSRAGIMWSDPRDSHQNAKTVADDLHHTLSIAGEHAPFVLVGHSLGGLYIMTYTKYFSQEVVGLVFVDAAHPEQMQRSNVVINTNWSKIIELRDRVGAALNWTGVVRVVANTYPKMSNLPDSVDLAVKAYTANSLGNMFKEMDAKVETLAEAGTFRQLGDRPLFVLTAMAPWTEQFLAYWQISASQAKQYLDIKKQMSNEQATWSSHSQHQLVPDANHYIQLDRPDIVIAAVRSVVEIVQAKRDRTSLTVRPSETPQKRVAP